MLSEVVLIQNKFNLVMQTVAKVIEINFKTKLTILDTKDINQLLPHNPGLLVIDLTILDSITEKMIEFILSFKSSVKIILITFENNVWIDRVFLDRKNIAIINLWQRELSIVDSLVQNIGKLVGMS